MKITLLEIENFKKIKQVSIAPGDHDMILIAGKNKQGKSSLMGAMSAALGGGKEAPDKPIREGEKRADIKIELDGGLVVHRKFLKSGKSSLEIKSKDSKLMSPQKVLDKLVGTRFLNPLEFSRLTEKKQREVLLRCVDVGLDLDEHAQKRSQVFDARTGANREVKRLKTLVDESPDPGDVPEQQSPTELLTKLDDLVARDQERINAIHKLENMRQEVKQKQASIDFAKTEIEIGERDLKSENERHELKVSQLEDQIAEATSDLKSAKKDYRLFVEEGKSFKTKAEELSKIDLSDEIAETKSAIKDANASNDERVHLLAAKERYKEHVDDLRKAQALAEELDDEVKSLDAKKAKALNDADMPIRGLDIDDEKVIYEGIPLSQASGAEQLQVSLAIAASLSPELKDIWVEDGALLDDDSLEFVRQFAIDNDLRIWLERVGESDDEAIVIVEGRIKE